MTLTGTYPRNLDDKQRVAVPKRLREQFGETELASLYVAPGTECSLCLYSPTAFDRLAQRLESTSSGRAEVRNYLRLFYARAERVPLDAQGRIRIPERLVETAGLKKDIVLLGVQDHAEIWDADIWQRFLEEHASDFDALAEKALSASPGAENRT